MDKQTAVDEARKMMIDNVPNLPFGTALRMEKQFDDLLADFEESVTGRVKGTVGEWYDPTSQVSGI